MRTREKCVGCPTPHFMDELGRLKDGDEVIDGLCETAIQEAALTLKMLGDQERKSLDEEVVPLPPDVPIVDRLEVDETGTETSAVLPSKICAVCLICGTLLIVIGYILGRFIP